MESGRPTIFFKPFEAFFGYFKQNVRKMEKKKKIKIFHMPPYYELSMSILYKYENPCRCSRIQHTVCVHKTK